MLHGNPSWSLLLAPAGARPARPLSLHRARPYRHGPVGQARTMRSTTYTLQSRIDDLEALLAAPGHHRPGDAGGARLGRHDRLRLGAARIRARAAPGDAQHRARSRCRRPSACRGAVARAAIRNSARCADPRLQRVRARRRARRRRRARCRADVRRAYVAPYDTLGQPHRDAALRAGHPAARRRSRLGAGRSRRPRAARASPTARASSAGACATSCSTSTSSNVHAACCRRPRCTPSTTPAITCSRTSTKSLVPAIRTFLRPSSRWGRERYLQASPRSCNARMRSQHRRRLSRTARDAMAMRCPGRDGRYGIAIDLRASSTAAATRSPPAWRVAASCAARARCVMVRPSPEFFLLMFALFKAGAVPVLVDPGIDRRALKQCLDEAAAARRSSAFRWRTSRASLLRWAPSARIRVTTGRRAGSGATRRWREVERERRRRRPATRRHATRRRRRDPVHQRLDRRAQGRGLSPSPFRRAGRACCAMRSASQPGGVDLPTFPPFALFDPALGVTSIIPDMDPTRPAQADPRRCCRRSNASASTSCSARRR